MNPQEARVNYPEGRSPNGCGAGAPRSIDQMLDEINAEHEVREKAANVCLLIVEEYARARKKHKPLASAHEGFGVIAEEVDEMWDEIKRDDVPRAKAEALQVAAMCVALILECD